MCAQKTLDSFYVLLLRESRKVIQVGKSRVQHSIHSQSLCSRFRSHEDYLLGVVDVSAVVLSLGVKGVENQGSFGERKGIDILELAKVEDCRSLFVSRSSGLGSRGSRVADLLRRLGNGRCLLILHCGCEDCAKNER